MKKILIFIVLAIVTLPPLFAQQETAGSRKSAARFERYYNNSQYDSIFAMFDSNMQGALPLDKTIEFLKGLKTQAGTIKSRDFHGYENSTYASYKTVFEHTVFFVNISIDNASRINGLFVKPYVDKSGPVMERNTTALSLPFKDEWTVVWGGDTKEQNYHIDHPAQKNAFDLVITDEKGKSYKTNGRTNEDFYAFGKEILAPCDGEVVLVVDGVKDNTPGELNPIYVPGNTVIIKTAAGEYLFFAHFKKRTIKVAEGQNVKRGQVLGLCGNSGNSSEPHLHFHMQNTENMNSATGVKCYFDALIVNGKALKNYSPVQRDKIKLPK